MQMPSVQWRRKGVFLGSKNGNPRWLQCAGNIRAASKTAPRLHRRPCRLRSRRPLPLMQNRQSRSTPNPPPMWRQSMPSVIASAKWSKRKQSSERPLPLNSHSNRNSRRSRRRLLTCQNESNAGAKPRPLFICSQCCRGAQRLFFKYGSLACQECHKLSYASRQRDHNGRKRLSAAKLRLQLGSLSDITEPLPAKPKWQRQKTYRRITNNIQALETKAKAQQFGKPIDTRLLAFHIA